MAFLTPVGRATTPDRSSLLWFPVVGALIGAVLGLLWWALSKVLPLEVVAAVIVTADLGLTGMLHMDGLVDAADGLLPPHLDRGRRLDVMKDPSAGAFGTVTVGAVLLLRWSGLAAIVPSVPLLIGIWAVSRSMMALTMLSVPYAHGDGGLASVFVDRVPSRPDGSSDGSSDGSPDGSSDGSSDGSDSVRRGLVLAFGVAIATVGFLVWRTVGGVVTAGAEIVTILGVVWFARRRVGGFTGDVLGAAGVLGETVALVVAAARW